MMLVRVVSLNKTNLNSILFIYFVYLGEFFKLFCSDKNKKQFNALPQTLTRWFLLNRRKEMFYLTMHSTHFIYGYMMSGMWLRTITIAREETRCRHYMGYSFRIAAKVILYAPSQRQDSTYHGFCYTSRGSLEWKIAQRVHHEESIWRTIAPSNTYRLYTKSLLQSHLNCVCVFCIRNKYV